MMSSCHLLAAPPPAAHPGLPGRQQQLESAIQALHKLKQQAANKPHGAAQQQQQHLIHHHSGMLAWQEPGVSAAAAQQLKQQQKEQQLSAVYGGSPLGDKVGQETSAMRNAYDGTVSGATSWLQAAAVYCTESAV